ncbi:MAG: hypothetical protein ACRDPY_22380 [Streptosporangiaceae bacterium]
MKYAVYGDRNAEAADPESAARRFGSAPPPPRPAAVEMPSLPPVHTRIHAGARAGLIRNAVEVDFFRTEFSGATVSFTDAG